MRGIGALLIALALLISGDAYADADAGAGPPQATRSLAESLEGEAREAFATGKVLFAAEDFNGALTKFQRAHELSKDPRLLFNMAVCEHRLRHYHRVDVLLRRYTAEAGDNYITPEGRAQIDELFATIKTLVSKLKLTVNQPGASVTIDGEPVTVGADGIAFIDIGHRKLRIAKDGFFPFEKDIEVSGGGEIKVEVVLVPEIKDARLIVTSHKDASIFVDGKSVGLARYDAMLTAGTHKIHVIAPSRVPHDSSVELRANETRNLEVSLTREGLPLWIWVGGGVVTATGLSVLGYFLFRPDDVKTPQERGTLDTVQVPTASFGSR